MPVSYTHLSLAQELGSIGKKVLLLDADIRKTAYAGRLGVEEEIKGLSQLLSGQVGPPNIISIFGKFVE